MSSYEVRGDELASEHLYFDQAEPARPARTDAGDLSALLPSREGGASNIDSEAPAPHEHRVDCRVPCRSRNLRLKRAPANCWRRSCRSSSPGADARLAGRSQSGGSESTARRCGECRVACC
jgi:hypothetical protein